ncbi:MAG: hypothetical protein AAGF97_17865 [Planctomycetota bacterium]
MMKGFKRVALATVTACSVLSSSSLDAQTRPVVPGAGQRIDFATDNLEQSEGWEFVHNHPKSSKEQDERVRGPRGYSTNHYWVEGPERGQPDLIRVVPTPANGLPGSNYSLLIRTKNSGIPGAHSYKVEQDDLVVDSVSKIGVIPVGETPAVVARIYLPEADKWEDRSGPHFAFRTQITTTKQTVEGRKGPLRRGRTVTELEPYWPGLWIHFNSKTDKQFAEDSATLKVRGNSRGWDFKVRDIPANEFGWWTFGMSHTPDGAVHFYGKPGVGQLTAADHISSQFPYSYRAQKFENMFFNICNKDAGQTRSTPFVIDDPEVFLSKPERVNSIVKRKQSNMARQAQNQQQPGTSR